MENFNHTTFEGRKDIVSIVLEELEHNFLPDEKIEDRTELSDLHSKLFNEDYFIVGYYNAEQWLIKNFGIFDAIGTIQEYENDNFGEIYTKLDNSETVVNMLAYILGEELIDSLDSNMTVAEIIAELKNEY